MFLRQTARVRLLGYTRVSTTSQDAQLQLDALVKDGVQKRDVIADKLQIATDARARGRTAEDAARLVGWSRATLYRHQSNAARESAAM